MEKQQNQHQQEHLVMGANCVSVVSETRVNSSSSIDTRCGKQGLALETSSSRNAQADKWFRVLTSRQAEINQLGAKYLHINVPNSDVLKSDSPRLPSASGRKILQALYSQYNKQLNCLVNPASYLKNQKTESPLYYESLDICTPWCCYILYQLITAKLEVPGREKLLGYPFKENQISYITGVDSKTEFKCETVRQYQFHMRSERRYENALAKLRRERLSSVYQTFSTDTYGWGSQVVYVNSHPEAIKECVVIFGDACSGDQRSLLTGMLAETFAEVHFIWSPSIDVGYIKRLRPSLVLTQARDTLWLETPSDHNRIGMTDKAFQALSTALRDEALTESQLVTSVATSPLNCEQTRENVIKMPLLSAETYSLSPPIMVQDHGLCEQPETQMHSNAVELTQMDNVQVYFTGPSWWVHNKDGAELLRHGIAENQNRAKHWWLRKRLKGTTLLFATSAGAHCYYHWMTELLPKFGMLEREGIDPEAIDHVLVREITGDWQIETLAKVGIPQSKIIETRRKPNLVCDTLLHIDLNCGINLKMPKFIPQWMKHLFAAGSHSSSPLKLYISRPKGVRRGINNEDELVPILEANGFKIQAMEGLSVEQQASLLSRAEVIMSPHGGGLTNMVFCKPGVKIVELFSRHVFPYYYGLAASCGHQYFAILENPAEDYSRLVNAKVAQSFADKQYETADLSFKVSIDAVKRVLPHL